MGLEAGGSGQGTMIMKSGAKVALAVAAGYYLGRRHKLRLAAAMAVAGVVSRRGKDKGGLLQQGVKALGSPELEEITGRLRGDLAAAGKTAAVAATSKQINAISDRLHERTEMLRNRDAAVDGAEGADQDAGAPEGAKENGGDSEGSEPKGGDSSEGSESNDGDRQDDSPRRETPEAAAQERR
ncbi:hypothetical protein [Streptosporangium sp. KLBMP 9127]|nr:hypothetical protein [Streptosporangium sp. KLBMP 9127]